MIIKKKLIYLLPFIPENSGVVDFFIEEIKHLTSLFEVYFCFIPLKDQKDIESLPFIKELANIVNKDFIHIYHQSIFDKLLGVSLYYDKDVQIRRSVNYVNLKKSILEKFDIHVFDCMLTHYDWISKNSNFQKKLSKSVAIIYHDLPNPLRCSTYDKVGIQSLDELNDLKNYGISNAVHIPFFVKVNRPIKNRKKISRLGFISSPHTPNINALREIMSLKTSMQIIVAGRICDLIEPNKEKMNIELMGRIDDINLFYNKIDGVIIPVKDATGISIKTLEAIANNVLVISTENGIRGTKLEANKHFIRFSNANQLEEILDNMISYKPDLMISNAREYIEKHHDSDSLMKSLKELFF